MSGNTAKTLNSKKYHYTYIIKNNESGKQYFGVRSCDCDPELDTYFGSSKYLAKDVDTLGINAFDKMIHELFDSREEANSAEEAFLLSVDAKNNPLYYNMANSHKDLYFDFHSLSDKEKQENMDRLLKAASTPEARRKMRDGVKKCWADNKDILVSKIHHENRDYSNHLALLARGRGKGLSRLSGENRTEAQRLSDAKKDSSHLYSKEAIAKSAAKRRGVKRPEHAKNMTGRKAMVKNGEQISVPLEDIDAHITDGWVLGSKQKGQSKGKQKQVECPYCGKSGGAANMKRYHMDNCKSIGDK